MIKNVNNACISWLHWAIVFFCIFNIQGEKYAQVGKFSVITQVKPFNEASFFFFSFKIYLCAFMVGEGLVKAVL